MCYTGRDVGRTVLPRPRTLSLEQSEICDSHKSSLQRCAVTASTCTISQDAGNEVRWAAADEARSPSAF